MFIPNRWFPANFSSISFVNMLGSLTATSLPERPPVKLGISSTPATGSRPAGSLGGFGLGSGSLVLFSHQDRIDDHATAAIGDPRRHFGLRVDAQLRCRSLTPFVTGWLTKSVIIGNLGLVSWESRSRRIPRVKERNPSTPASSSCAPPMMSKRYSLSQ